MLYNALTAQPLVALKKPPAAGKVFVLQSRDREARNEIERVLIRHGLQSTALQNCDPSIIEAFDQHTHQESGSGIVILAPGN
jgi:hypothetical protein